MKDVHKFIRHIFFISFIIVLIIAVGFFSKIDRNSVTYALQNKHQLLQKTAGPRIIFIGGSNLRFGIISEIVKDSLNLNPVNAGIFAGFGLKFIIDDIKPYLKEGDLVVLAAEYHQFYGKSMWGGQQLAQAINVCPENIRSMNLQQLEVLIKTIPRNNLAKLKATAFQAISGKQPNIKSHERLDGINSYGDTFIHWNEPVEPYISDVITGDFNNESIKLINEFNRYVTGPIKGKLYITFPSYAACGYNTNKSAIDKIEKVLKQQQIPILGTAQNYIFADSLFFNSTYHLGKYGATLRTRQLVQDIKESNK